MPSFILKPSDADRNGANLAALTNTTGTNFDYASLDFDAAAQERADWDFVMDEFYDAGAIYIDVWWKAAAIADNVVWQANLRSAASGAQWDGALGTDSYIQDQPAGTTEYVVKATITIASPGLAASAGTILRISRDADSTNATDDMAGDAKLLLVVVRFNVAG